MRAVLQKMAEKVRTILEGKHVVVALEYIRQRGVGITATKQGGKVSIRQKTGKGGQILSQRESIRWNEFQAREATSDFKSGIIDGKNRVHRKILSSIISGCLKRVQKNVVLVQKMSGRVHKNAVLVQKTAIGPDHHRTGTEKWWTGTASLRPLFSACFWGSGRQEKQKKGRKTGLFDVSRESIGTIRRHGSERFS
jgi:hypothetical protein